jgi:serine phosphatase RsbU (regulator of sigma subunit)
MTDDALIVKAVETADPQIVNGDAMVALREMFEAGSEPLAILEQLDTYAIALLPLVGQEHPVGMLSVVNTSRRGPFSDEDLDLLREIAARAGLVLDRARLYRQQRNVAEGLQRSMLHPPLVPDRLGVAVAYVPAAEIAQVGGDWYDAFMHPDGTTTLIIGDVMGHDVLAAAAMGETRTLVRTLAAQHAGAPARTIDDTERVMRQLHLDTLATVVVGRLESSDPAAGLQFRFANAGHPPPLLLHPDGRVDVLTDDTVDPLLGVGSDPRGERVAPVDVGSTLVLYTDGLVERRDQPVEVGIDRLCTTLSTLARATPQQVVDAILDTMLPERSEDDIALLVVRV